ncbi:Linoleate 9S-lipoxygenase 6 [Spatholobus suberectus]|nr:Linoleate 9S-lipoxygenase 6 [Spatholobus suberectus]
MPSPPATATTTRGDGIRGTVILMKKNVLDFNDLSASFLDRLHEFVGKRVSLQLISAVQADHGNGMKGKLGKPAYLEDWITTITPLTAGESAFTVTFDWEEDIGTPGAFLIRNNHHSEFYLKSLTLENVPGHGVIHFICNSWVYPAHKYEKDRIFFSNKFYISDVGLFLCSVVISPDANKDKSAWRTDEEFAREMLAGVHPVIIRCLQEFPPASKLDSKVYGDQTSTIRKKHIESNMDGRTVDEAIRQKKLFILDHHDALIPYLRRINSTSTKTYASRTILFLQNDGTLKPLAIELSLPHPEGDQYGVISKVYTPAEEGVENSIWQLAKAYVAVNDSGYHQLISHWYNFINDDQRGKFNKLN